MNKVFLVGNLTRDPELKYIPSGTAICKFSIAISSKYKTKDGEKKEDVVFVNNITAWARLAEICGEYLQKGAPVLIEGRLNLNAWEEKDTGKKRSQLYVVAEKIQMLGRKSDGLPKKQDSQEEAPTEVSSGAKAGDSGEGDGVPF